MASTPARRAALLAVCGYVAVAFAMTAPAWGEPGGRIAGVLTDREKFVDLLGWVPYAITHGLNPLHMMWIDLPSGINLMWETAMPAASLVLWPVQATAGPVAAYNVALVAALTLDGACTYLWLRRHTSRSVSAFAGGLLATAGPYAASRTWGHLNLLMFFTLPLIALVLENLLRQPGLARVRRGAALGGLAGLQVLLAEEPLAIALVVVVVALAVAALLPGADAVRRARATLPALGVALVVFAAVSGAALAYQFAGPLRIGGVIQPPIYVNDVLNFVVPTRATAVALGATRAAVGSGWAGSPIEWNGYIGLPLLALAVWTLARRRDRWLVSVAAAMVAAAVLGLGATLHAGGADTGVPLPGALLRHLPVLDNVLPDRFGLALDLGLAAITAIAVDRVLTAPRRRRALGIAALAAVAASLWPAATPADPVAVPAYFGSGGDVMRLPAGTAVLVFPVPYAGGPATGAPSVWQAVAGYRVRLFSALSLASGPSGHVAYGSTAEPLTCVARSLQLRGSASGCRATPQAVRSQLRRLGIRAVIVGPGTPNAGQVSAYVTALAAGPPTGDEGVLVWMLSG